MNVAFSVQAQARPHRTDLAIFRHTTRSDLWVAQITGSRMLLVPDRRIGMEGRWFWVGKCELANTLAPTVVPSVGCRIRVSYSSPRRACQSIPHFFFSASTIHEVRHECVCSKMPSKRITSLCSSRLDNSGPHMKTVWQRMIKSWAFSIDDLHAEHIARA